jgi:integrase
MARRVRQHLSGVFVFAIGAGLAETDPAAIVQTALRPKIARRRPAALTIEQARKVLTASEALATGDPATKVASRLLALTAVRPGIVRLAEPDEFEGLDGKEPIWRVPAAKMKLTRARKQDSTFEFIVPLSQQAVEAVQAALALSKGQQWLFPAKFKRRVPMADSAISNLYIEAGFRGVHVPHGWRASFSTVMNELAARRNRPADRAVIDLMLAHINDDVEAAYNRAAYMPRRRQLAQLWADMLLKDMPSAAEIAAS